jgi:uncharacterized protein YjbI with pentapeptide repeats
MQVPAKGFEEARSLFRTNSDFRSENLAGADFSDLPLPGRDFRKAILRGANFSKCDLAGSNFENADLSGANFHGAALRGVNFREADLSRVNFYRASLHAAVFIGSNLYLTNFRETEMGETVFADVELETCTGLDTVNHRTPSSIAVECLYRFGNNRPQRFLEGFGFPRVFRDYLPSLVEASDIVQFHSCFISYSHADEGFAHKLWESMKREGIRVWYAPEEMQGGKKLFDQIDRAIQLHDKLLLVLSKASINSGWVETEIRRARQQERLTHVRKLFPIRVCDMRILQSWQCFDSDTGRDIAQEIREYFIPDFSKWTHAPDFEIEFQKLRRDLKAEGVQMINART